MNAADNLEPTTTTKRRKNVRKSAHPRHVRARYDSASGEARLLMVKKPAQVHGPAAERAAKQVVEEAIRTTRAAAKENDEKGGKK